MDRELESGTGEAVLSAESDLPQLNQEMARVWRNGVRRGAAVTRSRRRGRTVFMVGDCRRWGGGRSGGTAESSKNVTPRDSRVAEDH